jgi:hypothetical protein
MVELVSTMAEEINAMKHLLFSSSTNVSNHKPAFSSENSESKLILVSDNDTDDDLDEDDDSDDDSDDESEDSVDEDKDEKEVLEFGGVVELSDTKVINFEDIAILNCTIEDDEITDLIDDSIEELDDNDNDEPIDSEHHKPLDVEDSDKFNFIKSIDISDLEESKNAVDFKKLTTQKLREIALEKGIIADNSKATKNQLIKLLETA